MFYFVHCSFALLLHYCSIALLFFHQCYFVLLLCCYTFTLVVVYSCSIALLFICDYSLVLLFVCGWSLVLLLVHHYSLALLHWSIIIPLLIVCNYSIALLLFLCAPSHHYYSSYYFNFKYHVQPCTNWVCCCCSFMLLLFHWCSFCLANISPPFSCVGSSYGVWNPINKLHQPLTTSIRQVFLFIHFFFPFFFCGEPWCGHLFLGGENFVSITKLYI